MLSKNIIILCFVIFAIDGALSWNWELRFRSHQTRFSRDEVLQQIVDMKNKVAAQVHNMMTYLMENSGWAESTVQLNLEPALANLTNSTNTIIRDIDILESQLQQSGNHHIIEACIIFKPVNDIKAATVVILNDQVSTSKTQVKRIFTSSMDVVYAARESTIALETLLDQCNGVEPGTEEACYNNISVAADTTGNDAITNALKKLSETYELFNVLIEFTTYSLNVSLIEAHNRETQELEKIKTCIAQQTVL